MKKYLLYVTLPYSYSILRPLQDEIKRRGGDSAWFFEIPSHSKYLMAGEKHIKTIKEAIEYNSDAVFVAGNYVYDFLPGIKVQLFHGLIRKRPDVDSHFRIRGFFDLYCTVGNESTPGYEELAEKHKYFKVVETGWSKLDYCIPEERDPDQKPTILYTSTFTDKLTSTKYLFETIEKLITEKDWDWLITLHPKIDRETVEKYKSLEKYPNVTFDDSPDNIALMKKADVMLSDSSSIVAEFLWFNKPVVTFRNNNPGNYLINVQSPEEVGDALERALKRPADLMENIRKYLDWIHPYRDGKSSARILDAVDDFIANHKGKIKKKPLNLLRKLKMRKKAGYFPFGPYYRAKK